MWPGTPATVEWMRRSVTSVFSQTDDLRAAIGPECEFDFVLTRRGRFHARLTQVVLHRLRLTDLEENLPRIAFIRVPKDTILVALTVGNGDPQVWGGASIQVSDLVTLGPDQCVHARTDGPCRWGAIWFPLDHFDGCSLALTGNVLRLPTRPSVWRPPPSVGRELHRLHAAAMEAGRLRSAALVDPEAAHGLEQQLIHVLIECLAGEPAKSSVPSTETVPEALGAPGGTDPNAAGHGGGRNQGCTGCDRANAPPLLQSAIGHEFKELHPVPPAATGAPRSMLWYTGNRANLRRRASQWVPKSWSICRHLPGYVRRIAFLHSAAQRIWGYRRAQVFWGDWPARIDITELS